MLEQRKVHEKDQVYMPEDEEEDLQELVDTVHCVVCGADDNDEFLLICDGECRTAGYTPTQQSCDFAIVVEDIDCQAVMYVIGMCLLCVLLSEHFEPGTLSDYKDMYELPDRYPSCPTWCCRL